ncbi:MAG: IS200/IS605 family element transposase accessory protein TnpB [Candidatus Lokiarchaeota archaeon]|nr:IS200/IS605 family element transposase accessory protein TnpB [Candidatus Lokiarchaeota archaeon]
MEEINKMAENTIETIKKCGLVEEWLLKDLVEMTGDVFLDLYREFCKKLSLNHIFSFGFKDYLRKIIRIVYEFVKFGQCDGERDRDLKLMVRNGLEFLLKPKDVLERVIAEKMDRTSKKKKISKEKRVVENVRAMTGVLSKKIESEQAYKDQAVLNSKSYDNGHKDDEVLTTEQIYLKKVMTEEYEKSTRDLCHRSKNLFNDLNYVIRTIAFHYDTTESVNMKAYANKFGKILDMIFPRFPDGKRFWKHVKERFSKANPQARFVEFFANYALYQARYVVDEFKDDSDNLKEIIQDIIPKVEPAYLLNFFKNKHLHAFRKLNKKYFKGLSTKNRYQLKQLMFNIRKENRSKFDKKLTVFLDKTFSYHRKEYTYRSFYESVYSEIWLRIILLFLQVFRETEIAGKTSLNEIMEEYEQFLESGLGLKSLGFKYNLLILVKHLDSYKNIGIAKVAQNIAKTFCDVWDSYVKSMDRYFRELEKGKEPDRPILPAYKPSDGVWLVEYDSGTLLKTKYFKQHIRDTFRLHYNRKKSFLSATSEFRFPNEHHEKLPPIRFRLLPQYDKRDPFLFEKLRSFGKAGKTINEQIELGREKFKEWTIEQFFANFRTIEINPIGNSDEYNLNITYVRKKDLNYELDQTKCLAIDLGLSILSTAVSNAGDTPLLYRGGRIKRANHLFITHGQKAKRKLDIINHLIYHYEHREKTILDAAKDHRQKFKDDISYHYYSKLPEGFSWEKLCRTDQWNPQHKHVKKLKEQVKKHSELTEPFEKSTEKKDNNGDLKKALDAEHDKKYYIFCLKYNVEKIERKITYLDGLLSELTVLAKQEQYKKLLSIYQEAREKANRIYAKRNHRVRDQLRKVARHLVDYCLDNRIGTIVLGYKKGWKNSNLARKFNQYWHLTPVALLIKRIKYNANLVGIKVYTIPEPYTSVRSAYHEERLGKVDNPLGIRGPTMYPAEGEPYNARGLFKIPLPNDQALYVHSDANGAFNIMRKFDQTAKKWFEANRRSASRGKKRRYPDVNPTDFFAYFRKNNGAHKNKILLAPQIVDLSVPNPKMGTNTRKPDSLTGNPIA